MKKFKKILGSVFTIGIVLAVGVLAVNAYFSDTETSTGNIFRAGAIDLRIDNDSYYNGLKCAYVEDYNDEAGYYWQGEILPGFDSYMVALIGTPCQSSWQAKDLGVGDLFFNFMDLKPGDWGEDTISLIVHDNDAWACMDMSIQDYEGLSEQENENNLALAQNIQFVWWADDGNNVLETDEVKLIFAQGPASQVLNTSYALADSQTNVWDPLSAGTPLPGTPFDSEEPNTYYIAKAWCFGELGLEPQEPGVNNPQNHPGITCNGEPVGNDSQSGVFLVDVNFSSIQARNNADFVCPSGTSGPTVGALLSSYVAPAPSCDHTVPPGNSIQSVIDNDATAGQTICLADGAHNVGEYPLRLNKDNLTLAGVNPPTSTATLAGGVIIDNDGVTVTGLQIGESSLLGEIFGVYINTGVDNAKITHNVITGTNTALSRGVVNATGTTSNALISNNVISQWATGIFMNPSSGMIMEYNTLTGNVVGSGNDGPAGNIIRYSKITGNSAEGVGVSDYIVGNTGSLSVNFNNIYSNSANNEMNNYNLKGGFTVDATNNWWGADSDPGANHVNGSGTAPINYTPWASSAYLEN